MQPLTFERLEDRILLAVTFVRNSAGELGLRGDGASDVVDIDGTGGLGALEVFVNGVSIGTYAGIKNIKGSMGAGNDVVNLHGVQIAGFVNLNMNSGADQITFDNNTFGGANPDANVLIGRYVIGEMGNNAGDLFTMRSNVLNRGITIVGNIDLVYASDVEIDGEGTSYASESTDVTIGGILKMTMGKYGDVNGDGRTVDLDNVNVGGQMALQGSTAIDNVEFTDCSFAQPMSVSLSSGNDILDLDDGIGQANRFGARVTFNGGAGTDTLDDSVLNVFVVPRTVISFESIV